MRSAFLLSILALLIPLLAFGQDARKPPLQVFILAGQSNMDGPANIGALSGGTTWTTGVRGQAVRCADGQTVRFARYRDPVDQDGTSQALSISF